MSGDPDDPVPKITDFGIAHQLKDTKEMSTFCGTLDYVAPEVLGGDAFASRRKYGNEVDMWSLGIILYMVLAGRHPFAEQDLPFKRALYGKITFSEPQWAHVSRDAQDLVRRLLEREPKRRISSQDALRHPWFADLPGRAVKLPSGAPLPRTLFDYSKEELAQAAGLGITARLPAYPHACPHASHSSHTHSRLRGHASRHPAEPQSVPAGLQGQSPSCAAAAAAEAAVPGSTETTEASCPQGVSGA